MFCTNVSLVFLIVSPWKDRHQSKANLHSQRNTGLLSLSRSTIVKNKGMVVARETLLSNVWGYDFAGESRTLDVHIGSLRHKLGECGSYIETVRNVGYRIS